MNVVARAAQVARRTSIDDLRFVTSAKEVSPLTMTPIKSLGVGSEEPFHSKSEVGLGRFQDEMKMIRHQTVGMCLPTRLHTGLLKSAQKLYPVSFVPEYRFTSISATGYMIKCAFIFNSEGAGHALKLSLNGLERQALLHSQRAIQRMICRKFPTPLESAQRQVARLACVRVSIISSDPYLWAFLPPSLARIETERSCIRHACRR